MVCIRYLLVSATPAFYCDCEHEISEVTQGHRLCLVYNLLWSGQGPAPSIAPTSQPLKRALRAVRRWEADANCPTKLIHVLEHEYTMQVSRTGRE